MSTRKTIGVIGGSGLYELAGLSNVTEVALDTPFGAPSDAYIVGELPDDGVRLIFLPRHGRGHRFLPSEINYAANIYGLKHLGAEYVLSVSAVGSLREHIRPGHVVLPDQFIDRTKGRRSSFFGDGVVGHISFADPICATLRRFAGEAAQAAVRQAETAAGAAQPVLVHPSGTAVVMEGPAFSTRAESLGYRAAGYDVIHMTSMPEAKLAREAELCYATMALATDYDCWHETEEAVTVGAILATLHRNVALAKEILKKAVPKLDSDRACACRQALATALITAPDTMSASAKRRVNLLIAPYVRTRKGKR